MYGKPPTKESRKYLGCSQPLDPLQGLLRVETGVWLHASDFLLETLLLIYKVSY